MSTLERLSIDDRMLLLRFVCSFAWADQVVRPQEREFVRRLVSRLDLNPSERREALGWLDSPPSPDSVDPNLVPAEHRSLFLKSAESIIAADDEITEDEREMLVTFARLLR